MNGSRGCVRVRGATDAVPARRAAGAAGPPGARGGRRPRGRPNLRVATTVSNHTGREPNGFAVVGETIIVHAAATRRRQRRAVRGARRKPARAAGRRRVFRFRGFEGLNTITPAYPGMSGEFEEGRTSKKGVTHASLERVVSEGRRPRPRDLR